MYVRDQLEENEGFKQLCEREPHCTNLIPEISKRAQGVWLWVFLVVRDLIRDIKVRESYTSLMRRVQQFPQELEAYFADILSNIGTLHIAEAAKIFLVMLDAA